MRRVVWSELDKTQRELLLQRPTRNLSAEVRGNVQAIMEDVALRGDAALRALTQHFDGVVLDDLAVSAAEMAEASESLSLELRDAIEAAGSRIEAFHSATRPRSVIVETAPGVTCERISRPINPVGLYVPAGSAPLPSTALMLTIPAALAGCSNIVLCTPPRKDGSVDPIVLAVAARIPGIRVFKLGGAQAIAAMTFGTASVPRCNKLFGPGNSFVDEAKRQAAQRSDGPAIDMPAGPSEVLVIADAGANAEFIASDLLSQAEHGADSQVFLLSESAELLEAVSAAVDRQLETLPRREIASKALEVSRLVQVRDLQEAIDISNDYAPEHLILALRAPREWVDRIQSAGTVFMGDWTPESLGDYCSGSNHVLPTGGAARAWSGLSVASFMTSLTLQTATSKGIANIGPCAVTLAEAEGLEAHARAARLRLAALP